MIDRRRLLPSEVARCCHCRRDVEVGEPHYYDTDNGEIWCDECEDDCPEHELEVSA